MQKTANKRKYALHYNDDALEKMEAHVDYLAQVSFDASVHLRNEFKRKIELIRLDPMCYARYYRAKRTDAILRHTLCGYKLRYRIVFDVIGDAVRIVDVQDCRQNEDKNLV